MQILSVSLKNIKSYRSATVKFTEGANGIFGDNGHGKTTILEAIGFALYDSLPYKNHNQLLRHGEKSGEVRVSVLANDEQVYEVLRKVGSSKKYEVCHPDTGKTIKGKEDVLDWLLENLYPQLRDTKDIENTFENMIGVPQGTFTAIFALTAGPRKEEFDRLLRVDDYRKAADELRQVERIANTKLGTLKDTSTRLDAKCEREAELFESGKNLKKELGRAKKELEEAGKKLVLLKGKKEALEKLEKSIQRLNGDIRTGRGRLEKDAESRKDMKEKLERLATARARLQELEPAREKHDAAENGRKALEKDRRERDAFRKENTKLEKEKARAESVREEAKKRLAELEEKEKELEKLKPDAERQQALEKDSRDKEIALKTIERELAQLSEKKRRADTDNMCPLMEGTKCTTVDDFTKYFEDQIARRRKSRSALEKAMEKLKGELAKLGDPKRRLAAIADSLKDGTKVEKRRARAEKDMERVQADIDKSSERESEFEGLDEKLDELTGTLEDLKKDYYEWKTLSGELRGLLEIPEKLEGLDENISKETARLETLEAEKEELFGSFSEEMLLHVKGEFEDALGRGGELSGSITRIEKELEGIGKELNDIAIMKDEMAIVRKNMEREEEFLHFVGFARETFKSSSEAIALRLVKTVSQEANDIYCDLMGDYTQELEWTKDFEVRVLENGREKVFRQLSGGEQMAAALAMRLALQRVLAHTDVVFLDEPTQNMDEDRRANLAKRLQGLAGFTQMFIISHDDTFTAAYENIIKVEKVNGNSRVADTG